MVRTAADLRRLLALRESRPSGERPVVASHTGLQGVCDTPRNLSDARMRRIARAGDPLPPKAGP